MPKETVGGTTCPGRVAGGAALPEDPNLQRDDHARGRSPWGGGG